MIKTWAVVLLAFFSAATLSAAPTNVGLVLGPNYSSYGFGGLSPWGFGGSAGTVVTFFPDSFFSIRSAVIAHYLKASHGAVISGWVPEASVSLNVNFNADKEPISVGIGYALESQSGLKCSGSSKCPAIPSVTTGPLIEAKVNRGKTGLFALGQVFVPNDQSRNRLHRIQTFIGVGYEFGKN